MERSMTRNFTVKFPELSDFEVIDVDFKKRRKMVEFFHQAIRKGVQSGDFIAADSYVSSINICLTLHSDFKVANGGGCLRKHHSLVYVATKLAFDSKLEGETPAKILNEIFACEGNFDKLLVAPLFWKMAATKIPGWTWKSDFVSREESVRALEYFVQHATLAEQEFLGKDGRRIRLVDFPMESYGMSIPLRLSVTLNKHDVLLILLRHGAVLDVDGEGHVAEIDIFVDGLIKSFVEGTRSMLLHADARKSLELMLAAVPQAKLKLGDVEGKNEVGTFFAAYPFLSPRSCGLEPPELKHLARCKVREALNRNWKLPMGIQELDVLESVKEYLDLGFGGRAPEVGAARGVKRPFSE